jgi:hypothetical protein
VASCVRCATYVVPRWNKESTLRTIACVMHLHTKLASTRKGDMSMVNYFAKMKEYIDEMAAVGKKLDDDDDDVVSYILT